MPKKVTPPPTGIWKQVARVQRLGLSGGMAGKGGTWLAVGIGAWGLQRVRNMAVKEDEILLREPLGPGETITIRHETTTQAEDTRRQKRARKQRKQLQQQAQAAEKQAKADAKAAERAKADRRKAREERRRRRR